MVRLLVVLVILATLNACASGSAIVTGAKREAVEPSAVRIYSKPPAGYEVIGVVKASSEMGFSEQGSMDYAVEELKKQAAAIGANGLVITGVGGASENAAVAAEAIFVQ